MAYMSQEQKKEIVALAKPILKKYGVKATFAVDHHTSLECNIKSGKLDFIGNHINHITNDYRMNDQHKADEIAYLKNRGAIQVNQYHIDNQFDGPCAQFLKELKDAMMTGNHDNSDIQTDYFDVGWYIHINIGRWNKPYVLEA
eukprot:gnl/Spiro4/24449_TR12118_c0_g1_i1.p1 gnl/Spiro4/24449_TR12118_c0_g1~~gnl/Spiro4/24449_TR12118_c0_g1_i1.p1  ORF type:complete len:143 (-),score=32.32 gnl/Spiro4/24449_TR12118_c0_g1_i1:214-642(-)